MAEEKTTLKDKSLKRESLIRGQRADTGGDHYDRYKQQYAKNPPVKEDDPFVM